MTLEPALADIYVSALASEARAWRRTMDVTRKELAALIGYSASSIQDYEHGFNRTTRGPISDAQWLRYRLACTAIQSGAPLAF